MHDLFPQEITEDAHQFCKCGLWNRRQSVGHPDLVIKPLWRAMKLALWVTSKKNRRHLQDPNSGSKRSSFVTRN